MCFPLERGKDVNSMYEQLSALDCPFSKFIMSISLIEIPDRFDAVIPRPNTRWSSIAYDRACAVESGMMRIHSAFRHKMQSRDLRKRAAIGALPAFPR
jgi:hypothetical protein